MARKMRGHRTWTSLMLGLSLAFSSLVVIGVAPPSAAAGAPPDAPAGSATTYQLNARHDGHSPTQLKAPLQRVWSHDFGAQVSYPLVVNGRVFVTTSEPVGPYDSALWALDSSTGELAWGPFALGSADAFAGIAADAANVYAVNSGGTVRAYNQATGTVVWSRQLLGSHLGYTSPPTVRNGTLYVVGLGTLYAVDPASGAVRWSAQGSGDHTSPAVTADRVIVQSVCMLTHAFNPANGSQLWLHQEGCQGGGGRTPVIHDDKVYVRDVPNRGQALLTATGAKAGTFTSVTAPAFAGDTTFLTQFGGQDNGFTLTAVDLATPRPRWSQIGDGHLVTAPLAIGDSVAIGSTTGRISLFDASSGIETWSAATGSPIVYPDEHNGVTTVGLGTSGDLLLVPATNTLVAYESGPSRAATRTRLEPSAPSQLGNPFWLRATVGSTDGGGTVSFFADGATAPMPGCVAVRLTPTAEGWQSTCPRLNPSFGNHTFTARYSGDAAYAPSKVTISHAVIAAKTNINVVASPPKIVDGVETQKLWGQLNSFNIGVPGRPVRFTRDGAVLCTVRTNWAGNANCVVPTGGPVQLTFAGSEHYRSSATEFVPTG
jgi:outer membrane protein assembly factor BamB